MTDRRLPSPDPDLSAADLYRRFTADPLEFAVRAARDCDGLAAVRFGWVDVFLVTRPDLIQDVLVAQAESCSSRGTTPSPRRSHGSGTYSPGTPRPGEPSATRWPPRSATGRPASKTCGTCGIRRWR